jgi:hypothetical protein
LAARSGVTCAILDRILDRCTRCSIERLRQVAPNAWIVAEMEVDGRAAQAEDLLLLGKRGGESRSGESLMENNLQLRRGCPMPIEHCSYTVRSPTRAPTRTVALQLAFLQASSYTRASTQVRLPN